MIEVRRNDDGELCGYVAQRAGGWTALTVFGGLLGDHADEAAAVAQVSAEGLASLAERWNYRADPAAEWQVGSIQEASPGSVRLALDYYSMPGVPTVTLSSDDLAGGAALVRDVP
ncbi:MAG TPA: hypothetical protein DCR14_14570 [Acidimicrobiaceae bacterium]|nr:hypothetical protein [Acidimicrobiaceae bacterium]